MQKVQKKSHSTHNLKKKLHETYFVTADHRTVRDHKYELKIFFMANPLAEEGWFIKTRLLFNRLLFFFL